MQRIIEPEWLDGLPPHDPRALRSRQDLRRINAWMGHAGIMARAMRPSCPESPKRVVELGAGDGTFLLAVARRLAGDWPHVKATLVDRRLLIAGKTKDAFRALGWTIQAVEADVFDWLRAETGNPTDALVANLFLHHFSAEQLRFLFCWAAEHARFFVACEPSRSRPSMAAARLLFLTGCNDVTQHDAVASVRAGFAGRELSSLWPDHERWERREGATGLLSHLFQASRTGVKNA